MFEHMDIVESIYKGVVEPSYKKNTREDVNHAGHRILKRGEAASSNTYSDMSERSGKHRKIYIDYPEGNSKPTCLIHGPGHSSDGCKIMGDFFSKYAKTRPTKDRGQDTVPRKKFNR